MSVREGNVGLSPKLRTAEESLSPPPPCKASKSEDADLPFNRWPNRPLPVPVGEEENTPAEAVASALSRSPGLWRRYKQEEGSYVPGSMLSEYDENGSYGVQEEHRPRTMSTSSMGSAVEDKSGLSDQRAIAERRRVPEQTPEWRGLGKRFESPTPTTRAPSTQVQSPIAGSTVASSPSTRLNSSRGTSRSRPSKAKEVIPAKPEVGHPVCFYLEGCVRKYVGYLKSVSDAGLYTVDLVGGGRICGLQCVAPCGMSDVKKASQLKRQVSCAEDPYHTLRSPNGKKDGMIGFVTSVRDPEASPTSCRFQTFSIGDPVSFSLERHELAHIATVKYPERFYGRIQQDCGNGTYIVEQAGGCRRKVAAAQLTACSDVVYQNAVNSKRGLVTRKDYDYDSRTPNSPAWGGGSGFSSGYRETSPCSLNRLQKSTSQPVLLGSSASSSSLKGPRKSQRSVSPPAPPRTSGSGKQNAQDFKEGSPVSFFLEGYMRPLYGRVRAVEAAGTYTIEVAGGRRICGVTDVVTCTTTDVENAWNEHRGTITRKDAWGDLNTRNRPTERVPSPIPLLRGVPINHPPQSATRMSAA